MSKSINQSYTLEFKWCFSEASQIEENGRREFDKIQEGGF